MPADKKTRLPQTAADYLEWVMEAAPQYPAMTAIEKHGCAHCFAAVYHPTDEEKRRGTCDDCHARAMDYAVQQWRDFEDQHADVLNQD